MLTVLLALGSGTVTRPAVAEDEGKPLDGFFEGRIDAIHKGEVTLRYDFSRKEQLKDWIVGAPFPVQRAEGQGVEWFDASMEIKGSTAATHIAEWKGDVEITCRLVPDTDKDVGGILVPSTGENDFVTYTLNETFFHGWDGSSGGQHSIIKFGDQWRESRDTEEFIGFRYVVRRNGREPVAPGRPVEFSFGMSRGKLVMAVPGIDMKGRDLGKRLTSSRPGFYTVKGRMLIDDVVIQGKLDPDWLRRNELGLHTARPLGEAGALDPEVEALLAGYPASGNAAPLVALVADTSRPDAVRQAAVDALRSGPKRATTQALDLLYSEDEGTRRFGIGIVKALLGKDYGFNPKSSQSARTGAIRKITEDLREHPDLLKD